MKVTLKEYLTALRKSKYEKRIGTSQSTHHEENLLNLQQSNFLVPPKNQEFKTRSLIIKNAQNTFSLSNCNSSTRDVSPAQKIRLRSTERAACSEIFDKKIQKRQLSHFKVHKMSESQVIDDTRQFLSNIHAHSQMKKQEKRKRRNTCFEQVRQRAMTSQRQQKNYFPKYEAVKASLGVK